MTPAEVLIQQRLAYEALSASTWSQPSSSSDTPPAAEERSKERSKVTGTPGSGVQGKGKKRLSVREMVCLSVSTFCLSVNSWGFF